MGKLVHIDKHAFTLTLTKHTEVACCDGLLAAFAGIERQQKFAYVIRNYVLQLNFGQQTSRYFFNFLILRPNVQKYNQIQSTGAAAGKSPNNNRSSIYKIEHK